LNLDRYSTACRTTYTMENSGNDDSRKKRDSTDVVERDAKQCEEKTKKLRAAEQRPNLASIEDETYQTAIPTTTSGRVLDLEVALQQIAHLGKDDKCKEYLSKTKWVQFRVGHTSDASTLATFYRKSRRRQNVEHPARDTTNSNISTSNLLQKEDTSLEVRLAEGLGDDDSPPSIFALLADVVCDNGDQKLVAAAVISSGWEDSRKVMLVKMFHVSDEENDSDVAELLERRMWLRLSALALMTSNDMIVEQGMTKTPSSNLDSK
jgi:hypothetical protein